MIITKELQAVISTTVLQGVGRKNGLKPLHRTQAGVRGGAVTVLLVPPFGCGGIVVCGPDQEPRVEAEARMWFTSRWKRYFAVFIIPKDH